MNTEELWLPIFWKAVHVFAVTFNPRDEETVKSYHCFYQSLSEIVPSDRLRFIMENFMNMTRDVQAVLFQDSTLKQYCSVENMSFLSCFQTPERLFLWTYLFHQYYNLLSGLKTEPLSNLKEKYNKAKIFKDDWGSSIWKILHYSTLYSKNTPKYRTALKAFLSCLRFCIPCPKCRQHLKENLGRIPFNENRLFEFTVDLHNLVNSQLGTPILSLLEARSLYM